MKCGPRIFSANNKLLDKHAPYIMSKSRSSKCTAIANSIKSKNKSYTKFYEQKNPKQDEIYEKQFKTYRNNLTTLLRITKYEYYKTHFEENWKKLKSVWKTIKEIINLKSTSDVSRNNSLIGQTVTTNAKLIGNNFNPSLRGRG